MKCKSASNILCVKRVAIEKNKIKRNRLVDAIMDFILFFKSLSVKFNVLISLAKHFFLLRYFYINLIFSSSYKIDKLKKVLIVYTHTTTITRHTIANKRSAKVESISTLIESDYLSNDQIDNWFTCSICFRNVFDSIIVRFKSTSENVP